jgi:hypothetical protein
MLILEVAVSVEVAFLTVVLRKSRARELPPEAFSALLRLFDWEPDWTREDEHLVATSFMVPADVRAFGDLLQTHLGLVRGQDWAVLDMSTGPSEPVPWLAFEGGIGQDSFAWLASETPGRMAKVRRLAPGRDFPPDRPPRVVKLFGRDNHHDDQGHREDFGVFLPVWGGRDLWCVECSEPGSQTPESRYLTFEIRPRALKGLLAEPTLSIAVVGGVR